MLDFVNHPGLLFVWATLAPLAAFLVLLLAGALRAALRPHAKNGGVAAQLHQLLGGEVTGRGPAYVALAGIFLAFVCSATGFIIFLGDHHEEKLDEYQVLINEAIIKSDGDKLAEHKAAYRKEASRWAESVTWASIGPKSQVEKVADEEYRGLDPSGSVLRVGYRIDSLAAIMFVMVTFIATLIHLFSIGYMSDELQTVVEDHEVHTAHGHLHRRGRFGRFFMFLSLFCFSMLNLVLADNLFQVFVSWELVGVCSYLLVGFYFERTSASNAANKAFITNRVGDAGFIIGLLVVWTYIGSFNFQEIEQRLRGPEVHSHGKSSVANQIVRAEPSPRTAEQLAWDKERGVKRLDLVKPDAGVNWDTQVVLMPRELPAHFHGPGFNEGQHESKSVTASFNPGPTQDGFLPYWMLVAAGLGIFLGCVGKSAQFPLQVWLPDAMEGPTPVSALIHAATMVAAGVYLVGRCYFLFTAEVLLTIAYTGAITLFVAATVAVVMTDIKKVLAYSTVSQLGYMMLGLGVGGWAAGLFHLLTHAFFKALLFLGSGSVIYGCHHQQDMSKMGGLYPKMKITALTMLVGCLAIAGIPLFSGWYSKDAVLASALGFVSIHSHHFLLFVLPLLTAGLTTFYMFRMWFLTFTGKPRDHHVHEHAHESPWPMTVPLVLLAFFSVTVAWGWPVWSAESSWLEHELKHARPKSVEADFGPDTHHHDAHHAGAPDAEHDKAGAQDHKHAAAAHPNPVNPKTHEVHGLAGNLALLVVAIGLAFAFSVYYFRLMDPAEAKAQFAGVHRFLTHKWYFDEFYSAVLVRPALVVAGWARAFDGNVIDGFVHVLARFGVWLAWVGGLFDRYVIDGLANLLAHVSYGIGGWLRGLQTGYLRSYVLFLVLAAVGIWVVMMFVLPATGAP